MGEPVRDHVLHCMPIWSGRRSMNPLRAATVAVIEALAGAAIELLAHHRGGTARRHQRRGRRYQFRR